ncbi:MAG: signal peptidase [Micrococcaceae bacterium]|jgi:signal peptidase|nr:signal peptidase [Micrococcaceae bacterium]
MTVIDRGPQSTPSTPAPVRTGSSPEPDEGPGGSEGSLIGRVVRRLVNLTGTLVVIGAVLVFLFLAVGPRFMGYQTATMLTGSMAPEIVPGDVVVTTEQPVADVQVGDVISYHIPVEDHRVETHRVVEVIANPDGTIAVRTKGDANDAVDPWVATLDGDFVYEQAFVVPVIGDAIRALRTPIVNTILVYGAPAVLVLGVLIMIWSRPTTPHADTDGGTDTSSASHVDAGPAAGASDAGGSDAAVAGRQ